MMKDKKPFVSKADLKAKRDELDEQVGELITLSSELQTSNEGLKEELNRAEGRAEHWHDEYVNHVRDIRRMDLEDREKELRQTNESFVKLIKRMR